MRRSDGTRCQDQVLRIAGVVKGSSSGGGASSAGAGGGGTWVGVRVMTGVSFSDIRDGRRESS